MARGRFIDKEFLWDEKVRRLPNDSARLLFVSIIASADAEGRNYGDPELIKAKVAPKSGWSIRKIGEWLDLMDESGLIVLYEKEGERYLYLPKFEDHQVGLRKDREAPSRIPPLEGIKNRNNGRKPAGKGERKYHGQKFDEIVKR